MNFVSEAKTQALFYFLKLIYESDMDDSRFINKNLSMRKLNTKKSLKLHERSGLYRVKISKAVKFNKKVVKNFFLHVNR